MFALTARHDAALQQPAPRALHELRVGDTRHVQKVRVAVANKICTFWNLFVWQRSVDLVVEAYQVAEKLPASERYELSAQIRQAAVSIPANIAEGHERRGRGYLHHLRIALGSLAELETHIEVAVRLGLLRPADVSIIASEAVPIGQMLHGLRRSVLRRLAAKGASAGAVIIVFLVVLL